VFPGKKLTRPEPIKIINILTGHFDVHSPHTTNDIHGENNCTKNSKFSQDVGCLFLAFVHEDVNLSKVIGMRTR